MITNSDFEDKFPQNNTQLIDLSVNRVPTAIDDQVIVVKNESSIISVLDNDFDPDLTDIFVRGVDPKSDEGAIVKLNDNNTPDIFSDDTILYTPVKEYIGNDRFSYRIIDESGAMAEANVVITVGEDSDRDGILDSIEGEDDSDSDGIANMFDIDSDNDGILDQFETNIDTDGDGIPNYKDIDSDGDSLKDSTEMLNKVFLLTNTNDSDQDGYLDIYEAERIGLDKPLIDSDNDGIKNYLDADDDNDTIPTILEDLNQDGSVFNDDKDGDGLANYIDPDDDGDNLPTHLEDTNYSTSALDDDSDGDSIPDYLDVDDDNDGFSTAREIKKTGDDVVLIDSDNDGIYDYLEPNNTDLDGDSEANSYDRDDDGDGILTKSEDANNNGSAFDDDSDNDGIPNFLDIDSDNDGSPDFIEGVLDTNRNGIPDYIDTEQITISGDEFLQYPKVLSFNVNTDFPNNCVTANEISLNLSTENASEFKLSNSIHFFDSDWETITSSSQQIIWDINPIDGEQIVFIMLKDEKGQIGGISSLKLILDSANICKDQISPSDEEIDSQDKPIDLPFNCSLDCNAFSYNIYLVDENNNQYSLATNSVNILNGKNSNSVIYAFEVDEDSTDYNDIFITATEENCERLRFVLDQVSTTKKFQVKMSLQYKDSFIDNIIIWPNTLQNVGDVYEISSIINKLNLCTQETQQILRVEQLIKGDTDTIYYYAQDGYRYPFVDNETVIAWFGPNFEVETVSQTQIYTIPLGQEILHRPGVNILQKDFDSAGYVIDELGKIRKIESEQLIQDLYGLNWRDRSIIISPQLFRAYKPGALILSTQDYKPNEVQLQFPTLQMYIQDILK